MSASSSAPAAASYVLGVDVGGTNTDAVLLRIAPPGDDHPEPPRLLRKHKAPTTGDVLGGLIEALRGVLRDPLPEAEAIKATGGIQAVMLGTTHFVNAVIQRRNLNPVCILRLCGPSTVSLPPLSGWPDDLAQCVRGRVELVGGGFEISGDAISDLYAPAEWARVRTIIREARDAGIQSFAVTGVFSPSNSEQEEKVGALIREEYGSAIVHVTLSHELSGLGLLERENSAILNASLCSMARTTLPAFQRALGAVGLDCPLLLTQNDGTLMSPERALRHPILTFSSGPTNSMMGALFLANEQNAIVVDVGGTSLDVGVLVNGEPRQVQIHSEIADVRVQFSLPDVYCYALGGGSVIRVTTRPGESPSVTVGPDSVAYEFKSKAKIFGGDSLTTTDVAVACGMLEPFGTHAAEVPGDVVHAVKAEISRILAHAIDRMRTSSTAIPVILVGGGSCLVDPLDVPAGVERMVRPTDFDVANAVGAALCRASGSLDRVVDLPPTTTGGSTAREEALTQLKAAAIKTAIENGAIPESVKVVSMALTPLTYTTGHQHRVQIKAIGTLDVRRLRESSLAKQVEAATIDGTTESRSSQVAPASSGSDGSSAKLPQGKGKVIDPSTKAPTFDADGAWVIDEVDVQFMALGANILGTGGGGDSWLAGSMVEQAVRSGSVIRILPSRALKADAAAYPVALMGAPTVIVEKLSNGRECLDSLQCLENLLHRPASAIFPIEVGGSNGLLPLLTAAAAHQDGRNLVVLDCDGMGRAFPELQMCSFLIAGRGAAPSCLADEKGNAVVQARTITAKWTERLLRAAVVEMGLAGGLCMPPLDAADCPPLCIPRAYSTIWRLGRAIHAAKARKEDVIESICRASGGSILLRGKVVNVERTTSAGFTRGLIVLEPLAADTEGLKTGARTRFLIHMQNEYLLVKKRVEYLSIAPSSSSPLTVFPDNSSLYDESRRTEELLVSVPDLITLLDEEKGTAWTSDRVCYGARLAVLVMPAAVSMTTEHALTVVGPAAFGYPQHTYKPVVFQPLDQEAARQSNEDLWQTYNVDIKRTFGEEQLLPEVA